MVQFPHGVAALFPECHPRLTGLDRSSRMTNKFILPTACKSKREPGLVGSVTRFLLSVITVMVGLSHSPNGQSSVFSTVAGCWIGENQLAAHRPRSSTALPCKLPIPPPVSPGDEFGRVIRVHLRWKIFPPTLSLPQIQFACAEHGKVSTWKNWSARGFQRFGKSLCASFSRHACNSASASLCNTTSRSPFFSSGTPATNSNIDYGLLLRCSVLLLSSHKVPTVLEFVAEISMTSSGKVRHGSGLSQPTQNRA